MAYAFAPMTRTACTPGTISNSDLAGPADAAAGPR